MRRSTDHPPSGMKKAKVREEAVQRRKQMEILELFGTIDFDPKYDYKKQRRKR